MIGTLKAVGSRDPDVLLVDEVLAVGDEAFQRKCSEKFADFRRAGKTIVLVSHSLGAVQNLCSRAAWFSHGRLMQVGRPKEALEHAERAYRAAPDSVGSLSTYGKTLARAGRPEEAVIILSQAISIDPRLESPRLALGMLAVLPQNPAGNPP